MAIWKDLISPVTDIIAKVVPDKDKANQLAHDITTMAERHAHEVNKGQLEVNKQEAAHNSVFVAGWRPFIGWTCGVALGTKFIALPLIGAAGVQVPEYDIFELLTLLAGMLGMGGLRTFEKLNGVAREK